MKRQRNTTQMKEQGRNSRDQINEEEISNLPEREFRIMIAKMLQRFENRMEKMQEAFNTVNRITKGIAKIKTKKTEMNNTSTKIKNTLEGTNSRITETEEWISELEDRMVEITAKEQNKGKGMKRIEESLRQYLGQHSMHQHSSYWGPRERKEKGTEKIFEEIIVENFPNMGKEIVNHV